MGSGKSTAASYFAEAGFGRIDSDEIVRQSLLPRGDIAARIADYFGPEVLRRDGAVDRAALARRVFSDDEARTWLEDLLHPLVFAEWDRQTADPAGKWIVEVPILFEKGLQNWFDFTVCVASSSDLQLSRLQLRGVSSELSRQRIAKQLPLPQKVAAADFVLLNDGSLSFLREQVLWLAQRWT
jgi:dephospho-CoA kinase